MFANHGEEIVPSPLSHLSLSTLPESGDSPSKTLILTLLSPGSSSQGSIIGRATRALGGVAHSSREVRLQDDISFLNLIEMRVDLNKSRVFFSLKIEASRNWEGRVCLYSLYGWGGTKEGGFH